MHAPCAYTLQILTHIRSKSPASVFHSSVYIPFGLQNIAICHAFQYAPKSIVHIAHFVPILIFTVRDMRSVASFLSRSFCIFLYLSIE